MWQADLGNGTFRNPILYADYSDPDAIRVGDDYYMVASSFCNSPALPILHSKDLVNWKVLSYGLQKVPEFRYRNPIHGCGVWAPAIRYHEGKFFICFPMPDEGIYMTTATDPKGPWSEPVNIRPGAGWIDPCPFWDEDGRAYLVSGVAKSRIGYKSIINMTEMAPDGMSLIGETVPIFNGNLNGNVTAEGPKMYKRNGYYYILLPAGGVKTGWQLCLRSKEVFGPYEHRIVMRQEDTAVNGPHQGAWVDTQCGEDWFLHFQDVFAAGRIVHLQPMHWVDDWPIIGQPVEGKTYGKPVSVYKKPATGHENDAPFEPDTTDYFENGKMNLAWQWNANFDESFLVPAGADANAEGSAPAESGLRLAAVKASVNRPVCDYRNLLLQKWPAPEFTCTTKIQMHDLKNGDFAGIVNMGVNYAALGIFKKDDRYYIRKVTGVQEFDCDVSYAREQVEDTEISLYDLAGTVTFTYQVKVASVVEESLTPNGETLPRHNQERVTMSINIGNPVVLQAQAGRWVGVKNGVFCEHLGDGEGGSCLVKEVVYEV